MLFVKLLICSKMLYTQACKIFEVNFGRTIRRRWPVVAPVNASCRTTHDSGTVWFAIPFNSTQFFLSLGASAVGRQSIFSACLNRFCNTPMKLLCSRINNHTIINVSNSSSFYSIFLGLPGLGVLIPVGALLSLTAARVAGLTVVPEPNGHVLIVGPWASRVAMRAHNRKIRFSPWRYLDLRSLETEWR